MIKAIILDNGYQPPKVAQQIGSLEVRVMPLERFIATVACPHKAVYNVQWLNPDDEPIPDDAGEEPDLMLAAIKCLYGREASTMAYSDEPIRLAFKACWNYCTGEEIG